MVWLETKAEKALRHCRDVLQVLPDVNNNMSKWHLMKGLKNVLKGKLLQSPNDP